MQTVSFIHWHASHSANSICTCASSGTCPQEIGLANIAHKLIAYLAVLPPPAHPRTERQAAIYSQRKRKLDLTLCCCCCRRKVSPRPSPRPTSLFSRDPSSPKYVEHRARTSTRDVLMFLFFSSLLNDADVTVKHQPKWQ
jgi:hypothetical protein